MFQLAIIPSNTAANFSLTFKTRERAEEALNEYEKIAGTDAIFYAEDDYGYKTLIKANAIAYVLFVDIEQAQGCKFDQDMAMNKAHEQIGRRLENMGFKMKSAGPKSSIIQ